MLQCEGICRPPLEGSLAAIADSKLNAVCFVDEEQARASAAAADVQLPFGGVPIGVKELDPAMFTKSGLMVGLGEETSEVLQVMDDLRAAQVDFLTIGQYLQPTVKHHAVERFVEPAEFESMKRQAFGKGFLMVSASPLTRSSYLAGDDFEKLRAARNAQLAASA